MSSNKNLTKSISVIIFFSLISKALGFLRETLMASKFGIGYEADTYIVAITATTFLASMISNSLSSTIIPISMKVDCEQGKKNKYLYFSNVINAVLLCGFALILLSYVLSPYIIKIFAYGFKDEQLNLAVEVNRLALPIILSIILTSVITGYLQSENRFTSTALIGVSLNIVFVIYLLMFGNRFGIIGLAIATIIAYLSQVFVLLPEVFLSNYRYTFYLNLKDAGLIQTIKLSLPVMIGLSTQQINIIVDKTMASSLIEGSIASLDYAATTSWIFIDVFVSSIITAIFPIISNAASSKESRKLRKVVAKGFKLILFISIPASAGMLVLATPIIRVLFERGAFNSNATTMTVQAFVLYSVATIFTALKRLSQKVYYSYGNTKTPMMNSVMEVSINIVLNLILVKYLGHRGLALSTSLAIMITSFVFIRGVEKLIGGLSVHKILHYILKLILSATIMGVFILIVNNVVSINSNHEFLFNILYLVFMMVFGAGLYCIVCKLLKIEEIDMIKELLRQKLKSARRV